jgi:hypothetical protein
MMSLSGAAVQKISNDIYRQFPEMKGVSPRIQEQRQNNSRKTTPTYLLVFETSVTGSNGKKIKRWVRVTVNEDGKIIRTSTSR